ncbi:MAG TPA: winged helix-turn-helix domain-containing protein [Acidimicrobiales bacterium]|nr:winged helix-turn-helix domain-containing protein [Acidimicrobiales bacterium]
MDVTLVRWPAEQLRRQRLAEEGVPRLLLVDDGEPPPQVLEALEDWIRVPADDADIRARIWTLQTRFDAAGSVSPVLDDDGVIRVGGAWASLPPVEARITSALLERFGAVVSREALSRSGWPDGAPGRNALDVHVLRLRRRLAPLGLVIRTVRSRGYLLEGADYAQASVREA